MTLVLPLLGQTAIVPPANSQLAFGKKLFNARPMKTFGGLNTPPLRHEYTKTLSKNRNYVIKKARPGNVHM